MRTQYYLYVGAVAIAATLTMAVLPWDDFYTLALRDWTGLAAFIGVGILAEALALNSAVGIGRAEKMKTSLAFLPLFACVVIFPPAAAIAAAAAMMLASELMLRQRDFLRTLINVSQAILAVAVATSVYTGVGERFGTSVEVQALSFLGLAVTFFSANMVLVAGALAIRGGFPFVLVLRNTIGSAGGNLVYGMLASPIALIAVLVYYEFAEPGLLLVLMPLLLIRSSYLTQQKLQRANRDLLQALVKAIETRDPYTSGHSVRVSQLARAIAEDLGLSRKQLETIEIAALLHDVGKTDRIYAELIQKRASLSDTELALIRTHATRGADLLQSLTSLEQDVISAVRHHHERFDGLGYPAGLSGESIPLGARIIMLCDSIDAMLSDRPYRPALSVSDVKGEIQRCAGTQFDPGLVRVVIDNQTLERARALVPEQNVGEPDTLTVAFM